jgi:hypothetical protein
MQEMSKAVDRAYVGSMLIDPSLSLVTLAGLASLLPRNFP